MKNREITHNGVVYAINNGLVSVVVQANSACAGCHVKGSCSMSETEEKIIVVPMDEYPNLEIGNEVTVVITREAGIFAVVAAYLIPVCIVLLSLFGFDLVGMDELKSFFFMLIIITIYYIILYLLRKKILNKINIKIKRWILL